MKASSAADKTMCAACGGESPRGEAKYCPVCGKLLSESYQPLDFIRSSYGMQRQRSVLPEQMTKNLFDSGRSSLVQTAWACVVYSMVPYLGILFLLPAFAVAAAGWITNRSSNADRRFAAMCFGSSTVILFIQTVLWSLLYIAPSLALENGIVR